MRTSSTAAARPWVFGLSISLCLFDVSCWMRVHLFTRNRPVLGALGYWGLSIRVLGAYNQVVTTDTYRSSHIYPTPRTDEAQPTPALRSRCSRTTNYAYTTRTRLLPPRQLLTISHHRDHDHDHDHARQLDVLCISITSRQTTTRRLEQGTQVSHTSGSSLSQCSPFIAPA